MVSSIIAKSSVNQNVFLNILSAIVTDSAFVPSTNRMSDFADNESSTVTESSTE